MLCAMRKAITERENADTPTADAVLGLSITAVHRRLNGDVEFTASELHRLGSWLGVSPATLLGDTTPAKATA